MWALLGRAVGPNVRAGVLWVPLSMVFAVVKTISDAGPSEPFHEASSAHAGRPLSNAAILLDHAKSLPEAASEGAGIPRLRVQTRRIQAAGFDRSSTPTCPIQIRLADQMPRMGVAQTRTRLRYGQRSASRCQQPGMHGANAARCSCAGAPLC